MHKNCYDADSLFHHLAAEATLPFDAKQQFLCFLMEQSLLARGVTIGTTVLMQGASSRTMPIPEHCLCSHGDSMWQWDHWSSFAGKKPRHR